MGFERDISKIITSLNEKNVKRQTILLSATLSSGKKSIRFITCVYLALPTSLLTFPHLNFILRFIISFT